MFSRKDKPIGDGAVADGSASHSDPAASSSGGPQVAKESLSSPEAAEINGANGAPNGSSANDGLDSKKLGTRVFKKSSPNGKITTYLGKRDFLDHGDHIDPIDGVVLIDPEYLKERKVHAHVLAAFRYGREDLDVLGLTFRKDLFLATFQVYPPMDAERRPLTRLQERLIKKLGSNAFPFYFEIPGNTPASVTLQPAPGDTGKPCGVDYELKTYVSDPVDQDKPHKRSSVRLAIRKLTYAPATPLAPQPFVEESQAFLMSPAPLHMECSLDKEMYYHGESITVNVLINNNSNKTVKKIKITVRQYAEICLFSTAQYKCPVAELESEDGFPLGPSTQMSKVYSITPVLDKEKRGLALDGKLKHEDTNLASSTLVKDPSIKENLGIIVSYKVKVRLFISMGQDVSLEIPFTLTHPKPEEAVVPAPSRSVSVPTSASVADPEAGAAVDASASGGGDADAVPVDTNLIQLEDEDDVARLNGGDEDDDIIFEDFARLRLKGHDTDDLDV